ncbi:cilia- and flagella-associated protein 68 isoform X1 [Pseudorca crassidens]|uniref:cilia- and flagella-associated protein 68 isoform X1 n=1 Tax=Pseudorca crassidens TaxID=82174 RepID=UPI00352BFF41
MTATHCYCCSEFLQREFLSSFLTNPHRGSLVNADGHAEVWTDWNDMSKFFQYGWRCTTNEDAYSNRTLMGNWNQERYDLKHIVQPKPLPSQFGHYFETTYDTSYNKKIPLSTHSRWTIFFFFFFQYTGLSLLWPVPLRSTGSAAMVHRPSCSAACGIFPDRGTNPCPLHRQVDSQPLRHQGSPRLFFLILIFSGPN